MAPAPESTNSMYFLATSSNPRKHSGLSAATILLVAVLAAGICLPAVAKVFLTVDESLQLAFPDCELKKETIYLTSDQALRAEELGGIKLRSSIIHRYLAFQGDKLKGTAYFDTHRVRTLAETLMVVVDPQGATSRLEILSFKEPEDYIPRNIWYRQFDGRPLSDDLRLKQEIRGVTGATLTARATTEAVRRVLALHRTLSETPSEESGETAGEAAKATDL